MTQIVTVAPGQSTVVASGPQFGVKYTLTGPDGSRIVFNDSTDADYVGWLTDLTGLDSPELRESADDLIGDDGGVHGDFFHGRRPVVLEGMIDNRPAPHHYSVVDTGTTFVNEVVNPSFEATPLTTGWTTFGTGGSTAPVMSVSTSASHIEAGAQATFLAYTNNQATAQNGVIWTSSAMSVTPGELVYIRARVSGVLTSLADYQLGYRINAGTNAGQVTSKADTVGGASSGIVDINNGVVKANGLNGYVLEGIITVPAGVTSIQPAVWARGLAPAASITFVVDGVMFVRVPSVGVYPPVYFDGNTSPGNTAPFRTTWDGTANSSVSRYYETQTQQFDATQVRNIRATALQRVTNALRRDLTMRWAPKGGVDQVLYCRRQQPLRITGAFNKAFQAALVAADYRIYAAAIEEAFFSPNVSTGSVQNDGTTVTPPVFTVYGPATNIQIHNISTGKYLRLATTYSIAAGEYIVFDTNNKTIIKNGNADIYGQLLFATSQWWGLEPGPNNVEWTATGTTGASSMVVRWQDAWV